MIYLSEILKSEIIKTELPTVSFISEFDVIICGLGTAGSHAAIFTAENGLKVLGIEKLSCMGGTHTAGGVGGHYFGCPGGRYEVIDKKANELTLKYTLTSTESRKFVLENKFIENGGEIIYEASVCGVYLEDNKVIGLRVLTKNGIVNYKAKIIMDCTAEAQVAFMAGCKTECGRESDGQTQPYTLSYLVFDGKVYHHPNVDFGRVNQFDNKSLTDAILYSRANHINEGQEGKKVITQLPVLGIREGRRIIAEESVNLPELFSDKKTETPMFYSYADLDKHGWDIAFDSETLGDWAIGANLGAYNITVAVPYKAILPLGFEGLLVPCRALGVDRDISSCVRMVLDMKKAAEAAAEWATLAIRQNKTLREVSYNELKEKLIISGCLDYKYNRGYRIDGKRNLDGTPLIPEDVHFTENPINLKEKLITEKPGEAIWSAKRLGEKALPTLLEYLNSSEENLRKHSAFAIAITGSNKANEILRNMVKERDGLMLKDCRKNNNLRGAMAIYFLGRLGDRKIIDELINLITDENEQNRTVYHQKDTLTTRYKIKEYEDIYFQFISQATMALIRIGNKHKDLQEKIKNAFIKAFSSDDYYYRITTKPKLSSEGNMAETVKAVAFNAIKNWK